MTHRFPGRRAVAPLAMVAAVLAACGGDMKTPEYANDGDTGAAAPATQQTLSPNPAMGDSTTGMSRGTGRPGVAGDTAGSFGKAAGASGAVPGQPTSGPPGAGLQNATGAPQSSQPATANPLPTNPQGRPPR